MKTINTININKIKIQYVHDYNRILMFLILNISIPELKLVLLNVLKYNKMNKHLNILRLNQKKMYYIHEKTTTTTKLWNFHQ